MTKIIDASTGQFVSVPGTAFKVIDQDTGEFVTISPSSGGTANTKQFVFTVEGDVSTSTGAIRIPNRFGKALVISAVYLDIDTAPVGSALIVDINLDGTTIFTNQAHRPQIAASAESGSTTTIDVISWAVGSYLTMDVDQVGSGTAGSNLTVTVVAA